MFLQINFKTKLTANFFNNIFGEMIFLNFGSKIIIF